jgi:hypothetical protein
MHELIVSVLIRLYYLAHKEAAKIDKSCLILPCFVQPVCRERRKVKLSRYGHAGDKGESIAPAYSCPRH